MGDSPLSNGKKDIESVLNLSADIPNTVKSSIPEEEFDQYKFNKAVKELEKEFQSMSEDKLKKLKRQDIINKLKGKYTSGKQGEDKKKFSLPYPPAEPTNPFTPEEIASGNIFYLINEAAKVDSIDQLNRYIARPEFDRNQFREKRAFRVPASKFSDNTGGMPSDSAIPPPGAGPSGPSGPIGGPSGPISGPSGPISGPSGPISGPSGPISGPSGPADDIECGLLFLELRDLGLEATSANPHPQISNAVLQQLISKNPNYTRDEIERCFPGVYTFESGPSETSGSTGFGSTGFGSTGFGSTGFGSTGFGSTGFGSGQANLSNFSGRINVKGNLSISGTLDIDNGNLVITGITPQIGSTGFGSTGFGSTGFGSTGFGSTGFTYANFDPFIKQYIELVQNNYNPFTNLNTLYDNVYPTLWDKTKRNISEADRRLDLFVDSNLYNSVDTVAPMNVPNILNYINTQSGGGDQYKFLGIEMKKLKESKIKTTKAVVTCLFDKGFGEGSTPNVNKNISHYALCLKNAIKMYNIALPDYKVMIYGDASIDPDKNKNSELKDFFEFINKNDSVEYFEIKQKFDETSYAIEKKNGINHIGLFGAIFRYYSFLDSSTDTLVFVDADNFPLYTFIEAIRNWESKENEHALIFKPLFYSRKNVNDDCVEQMLAGMSGFKKPKDKILNPVVFQRMFEQMDKMWAKFGKAGSYIDECDSGIKKEFKNPFNFGFEEQALSDILLPLYILNSKHLYIVPLYFDFGADYNFFYEDIFKHLTGEFKKYIKDNIDIDETNSRSVCYADPGYGFNMHIGIIFTNLLYSLLKLDKTSLKIKNDTISIFSSQEGIDFLKHRLSILGFYNMYPGFPMTVPFDTLIEAITDLIDGKMIKKLEITKLSKNAHTEFNRPTNAYDAFIDETKDTSKFQSENPILEVLKNIKNIESVSETYFKKVVQDITVPFPVSTPPPPPPVVSTPPPPPPVVSTPPPPPPPPSVPPKPTTHKDILNNVLNDIKTRLGIRDFAGKDDDDILVRRLEKVVPDNNLYTIIPPSNVKTGNRYKASNIPPKPYTRLVWRVQKRTGSRSDQKKYDISLITEKEVKGGADEGDMLEYEFIIKHSNLEDEPETRDPTPPPPPPPVVSTPPPPHVSTKFPVGSVVRCMVSEAPREYTKFFTVTGSHQLSNVRGTIMLDGITYEGEKVSYAEDICEYVVSGPPASSTSSSSSAYFLTPISTRGFFETQQSLGCGRHALNNLLGGLNFTKGSPANAYKLDNKTTPISLQEVCTLLNANRNTGQEPLECPSNENYDTNVLRAGLNLYGFPVEQTGVDTWEDKDDDLGYVVNRGGAHWVALRRLSKDNYLYIDSADPEHQRNKQGARITKQQFLDAFRDRISQILVVKRDRKFIDILQVARELTIAARDQTDAVSIAENVKLQLSAEFNNVIGVRLNDSDFQSDIVRLLRSVDSNEDTVTFISEFLEGKTPAEIDTYVGYLNTAKDDIQYIAGFSIINKKFFSPEEKDIYNTLTANKKLGICFIRAILQGRYNPLTERERSIDLATKPLLRGGGDPPKSAPEPKKKTLTQIISKLINYTRAFEKYGLTQDELVKVLTTAITLVKTPGSKITEYKTNKELTANVKKLTTDLKTKQKELTDNQKNIDDKNTEIVKTVAEEAAELDPAKKEPLTKKLETQREELETLSEKKENLETEIQTINDDIQKNNPSNKIFKSAKATDDTIINDLKSLSNIPDAAMDLLVEKLKTLTTYVSSDPPISKTQLENLETKIAELFTEDEKNVNFKFTPLQYAVYVANKLVIEQLIKNNVPINLRDTLTDPEPNGTRYTLEALADKRDSQKDTRKQAVVALVNEIRTTRDKATSDYDRPVPQIDKSFLQKYKDNEVVTLVYNKTYQEMAQQKGGPSASVLETDDLRYAEYIEKAKKDARTTDPKTKVQGVPDPALYRPLEWKAQNAMLPGASAAYTRYYDIERATLQGELDGKRKPPVQSPEYSSPEYDSPPLQAIKDAYLIAFRRESAVDFDRGFYDGLAAKPVSTFVSGISFLEADWITSLFESASSSISSIPTYSFKEKDFVPGDEKNLRVRDEYRLGYLKGITQLITPNSPDTGPSLGPAVEERGYHTTVKEAAIAAGIKDAKNVTKGVKKYTTPAEYYAADTRSASRSTDRSRKEIPIKIFLDKMITNYADFVLEPGAEEADKAEAARRQEKINELKKAYDDAYDGALTGRVQTLKEPAKPPLTPSKEGRVGGTRKHKKRTPKRRTLRRK